MKRKAPLTLMELMVMIAVFSLCAALCLQAFVKSDRVSRRNEARDRAVALCQSAAEVIRHTGGDFSAAAQRLGATAETEDTLLLFYGADWQPSEAISPDVYPFGYTLGICRIATDVPGLEKAGVWVREDETGQELFRIEVSWQKGVLSHG